MRNHIARFIFAMIMVMAVFPFIGHGNSVSASARAQEFCFVDYEWDELDMGSFVLVFPLEQTPLAEEIFTVLPTELDTLMDQYSQVFGTSLVLPVTIRIYPTHEDYYCLNPLAAVLGEGAAHTHVGEREIGLFALLAQTPDDSRMALIRNALRHELAALFAERITGGYAPPGLLVGLGGYVEDPAQTFSSRYEAAGSPERPDTGWQALWENRISTTDAGYLLQTTSTAAYLIDVYGWTDFIAFLSEINKVQGYRQALISLYGLSLSEIENHWGRYFQIYVNGRWQANIFHSYDLAVYQELLSAGAYKDSIAGLTEAVSLLKVLGDADQISDAEELLAHAVLGAEAGDLALQSRQALLSGRYLESYTSAEEALNYYAQLDDPRRLGELQTYMALSKEVLDLRAGLEVIREKGIGINPLKSQEVFEIGLRLLELGDAEGVGQAEKILFLLGAGQNAFFQFLISVVVLISTGLIIRRILSIRKEPPPEADLL